MCLRQESNVGITSLTLFEQGFRSSSWVFCSSTASIYCVLMKLLSICTVHFNFNQSESKHLEITLWISTYLFCQCSFPFWLKQIISPAQTMLISPGNSAGGFPHFHYASFFRPSGGVNVCVCSPCRLGRYEVIELGPSSWIGEPGGVGGSPLGLDTLYPALGWTACWGSCWLEHCPVVHCTELSQLLFIIVLHKKAQVLLVRHPGLSSNRVARTKDYKN